MVTAEPSQPPRGGMLRNVFHLGVGQVATTVLAILLSAAIARTLGASDFGLLYFLTSIATFAYVIVDWGHGPYIVREVARHPNRSGELLGSVLTVRAAMALAGCVVAVAVTWLLGYDWRTRILTATLILALLPQYLGLSFTWVFRGRERMDCDALLNVVLKFATLVSSLICLALGGRLLSLILAYSIAGTITFFVAAIVYRRLRLPVIHPTVGTARELVRNGAPMLAMSLAVAVQPYFDANILYKLAPVGVVGWYGAAWNVAGTLVAPAMILGATMYPRLSRAASNHDEFKRALRAAFRPLLFVAVLGGVGTYLFADVAIALIYSRQKFGPAGTILKAFSPALLLLYVDLLFSHAILAAGKAGRLATVKVAAVLITTGLEFVLVPFCQMRFGNGGVGIMLAMGVGEVAMVTAAMLLIREAVDGRMLVDFLRGLASGGATLLLVWALPPLSPFVGIPVCVLAFVCLATVIGLVNRQDFQVLATAFRKGTPGVIAAGPSQAVSAAVVDPLSDRAR
jgi:O-antigen/teichoic acid export membrane protein